LEQEFGNYRGCALKGINTTGSTLNENVRLKIEAIFGVKVFDSYSCEGGAIFFECPNGNYHPSEEYAIQEYIEDDYTHADPEKPLRHITTDLHNLHLLL
jgi:phenylacetate-coenzyme A ligase PaaK-like adenylate-forming protein